jgi:hypothetical protein
MCQIWAYYHKLFNECGHIIARLAWKPWIFVHGRSFFRTLFRENIGIPSLIFLLVGRPHLMMWRKGLPFFWIFYGVLKNRPISSRWSSVARGWIMQSCCRFFDEMPTCEAKNDFLAKITSKLRSTRSSNLSRFQLNRPKVVWMAGSSYEGQKCMIFGNRP